MKYRTHRLLLAPIAGAVLAFGLVVDPDSPLSIRPAIGDGSSLTCSQTSGNTSFGSTAFGSDCAGSASSCVSRSGVVYSSTSGTLTLPGAAGNFQTPPVTPFPQNVFFAAPGDFDRDGWDDFVAADSHDMIYMMRNQTITCGTTVCSGTAVTAPTVQTIPASFWNTVTNVRPAAFRSPPLPLKAAGGSSSSTLAAPIASGDFDGDGWTDFAEISLDYTNGNYYWPTAARLFLNTKNCHDASYHPCGIGELCGAQTSNGVCSGGSVAGSGTPNLETNLSCTGTGTCPTYMPTFATYDLRTGAATTATGGTSTTATTYYPGDFGPMDHAVQNIQALDWDGDGDIDILFAHSSGTCPSGTLCSTAGRTFYAGIDVWLNDCRQSAQWNGTGCPGHIPTFSHSTGGTCTGTSCNNTDVLMPSTANNTTTIAPNLNLNIEGVNTPTFAFADIDNDGDLDLVLGAAGCCATATNAGYRLRVFRGTTNSPYSQKLDTANPIMLSTSNATYPGFEGSLTAVFAYDFSGDGYPDIITGSDDFGYGTNLGARTRYWKNTGNSSQPFGASWPSCSTAPATCAGCTATCNPNPTAHLSEYGSPGTDFDMGLMLDYDHDPYNTKDIVYTDGNSSNQFYLFPNRTTPATYSPCGTVASGTLAVPSGELVISGACLAPTSITPSGTSLTYAMSNDGGSTWNTACTQTATGFSPALVNGQCCVTFPSETQTAVKWQAVMDSNTSDGAGVCTASGTVAPTISAVNANYTYTPSAQHYRAGVITNNGLSYVGSFVEPGDRGHLYANDTLLSTTYWDFAKVLDGLDPVHVQGTRHVFTSTSPSTGGAQVTFDTSLAPGIVGAPDVTTRTSVINWILSARFGVSGTLTKLGAIVSSTPAILGAPYRPNYYSYASAADRSLIDTFAAANASRVPLVIFGAKDGLIHAMYSIASSLSDARNGTEAWAFVPPLTAQTMYADWNATQLSGTLTVSSYPDGSPTLLDYKKSTGQMASAAIVASGLGGTSLTALDVTATVSGSSVAGPTPLWSAIPGNADAGKAQAKAAVARTLISGVETTVVVAATGQWSSTDMNKGRTVAGYNLETGALLWQFEAACPVTSDVTVFETDDAGEPGSPTLDGYIDRAVFADYCGYVYKINPGQNLAGGYMSNTGYGTFPIGTSNGATRFALFSTALTLNAVGSPRPIAGTIGARTDATTNLVLFFGTGGLATYDTTKVNEFYAVYANTGVIRSKLTGACTANNCEKFYGGVVVTPDDVIIERTTDASLGNGSSCDFGSTHIQELALNGGTGTSFTSVFDVSSVGGSPLTAVAGPLYGNAGALYFATVSGQVARVGAPADSTPGSGQANNGGMAAGDGVTVSQSAPFTLVSWRVVL